MVKIRFFGMHRIVTGTDYIEMPIAEKTSVNDAIVFVRKRYPDLVLDDGTLIITVNHEKATRDTVLRNNDTVELLPFIGGG